jgi:hypothetical protein
MVHLSYLVQWGHTYLIHFGAWVSFMFGASIYKEGLPELKSVPNMFKTAIILSAFLSAFSSHSHTHYIAHFVKQAIANTG